MTRRINSTGGSIVGLAIVVVLWIVSLKSLQVTAIGDYGLVSALPVTMYVALGLLTISMIVAIHRGERASILAAHLIMFILIVHGTPAIVYSTLRYAWAWKHLGLIDYLTTHHSVNPTAGDQLVYQNWPGFFTTTSTWLSGAGLKSWSGIAQWAPVAFELMFSFAVFALLGSLERDRRLAWLGVWFFVIGNWVGQDYFSPQAYAYFLYLAVLVIVFRWLARHPAMPVRLRRFARAGFAPQTKDLTEPSTREQTRAGVIIALLCVVAIASSHPLTPIMLVVALLVLALTRVLRVKSLPLLAAIPTFAWLVTGARSYTNTNTKVILDQIGALDTNVTQNLSKAAHAVPAQHLVSTLGRVEVVFLGLLAVVGIVRRIRHGQWDLGALVLAIVPIAILAGGSYGGEAIFRVYLFALPFLAYFAAASCYPVKGPTKARSAFFAIVASGIIVSTFLFAYYGKEGWSYFTRGEVRAGQVVFDNTRPGSLIVEGTPDFPTHFKNYADFNYVDISSEPAGSQTKVFKNPEADLYGWLADTHYTQGYLIITRSQKAESDALGLLPPGELDKIEKALLASPRFKVLYHDDDAVVFTVPRPATTEPTPAGAAG